jgi:hypothetical protein
MTLLEVLAAADEQVVGLAPWQWQCWGTNCVFMALGTDAEDWGNCVFDTETLAVFAIEAQDPASGHVLRWVDPDWREAWQQEAGAQDLDLSTDGVRPIEDTTEQAVLIALTQLKEMQ